MANPSGVNQAPTWAQRPPYGDAKRQMELAQQAALAGTPAANAALNAPRRAQRSTQRPSPQAAPPAPPAPAPQISPQVVLAQQWQQIAAIPGASDLVRYYAAKANG